MHKLFPLLLSLGWAFVLGLAFQTNAAAQSADDQVKRVLLISTGSRLAPGFVMVDQQIMKVFGRMHSPQIELYAENLDITRFPAESAQRIFGDYLAVKYANQTPDLVVLIYVGNLGITAKVLSELFPQTPIVVAGYSEEDFQPEQLSGSFSGFAQRVDPGPTLDLIARLHPDFERLIVIGGTADVDRQLMESARKAVAARKWPFAVEFWDHLRMADLRKAVQSLPQKTAILYVRMFRDAAGQGFISSEVGRWLGQSANAPVYTLTDPSFGTGAVGGVIASVEAFGAQAGELARRILTGTPSASLPFEIRDDTVPLFDWRALKRWGIREERLPADSVIRFREPTIWDHYGWYIAGAALILLLQSLMIAGLVLQARNLRRMQASLRQNQQLMELATEAGGLGLWSRDPKTGALWANGALRQMMALDSGGDLRFEDVMARIHPDDQARVEAALEQSQAAEAPLQIEYRIRLPDGAERWVLARGRSMLDPHGRNSHRMGVVLDITERKRAEESLYRQQAFLRQVIDTTPNFIFAKDREGRFTLANQAVAEAYGAASADELIGKTDAEFNQDSDEVDYFRRMDIEVMDTLHERFIPEERLTDAYGRVRWLQTVKRPIVGPDGAADQVLGASTDITQRKRTEMELEEQRAELAHIGRISMMGELAAALVHEINQPLTAILSNARAGLRFMARDPVDLAELRDVLEDIVAANNRAADIIHGMRALVRKEPMALATLDLAIVVGHVARLAQADAVLKNVRIALELDEHLPPIRADRVQLQQVLLNILLNAFDAMQECEAVDRVVLVRAKRLDSRLNVVTVSDRGAGLAEEQLGKIFQPFYTTKRDGMGIGLSICRSIIKAHGGSLWAENNPEGGATFCFTVPVAPEDASGGADRARQEAAPEE